MRWSVLLALVALAVGAACNGKDVTSDGDPEAARTEAARLVKVFAEVDLARCLLEQTPPPAVVTPIPSEITFWLTARAEITPVLTPEPC
jgi:hypothetical protein